MVPPAREGDLPAPAPVLTLTLADLAELAFRLAADVDALSADEGAAPAADQGAFNLRILAILLDMAEAQRAEAGRSAAPAGTEPRA